MKYVNFSSSRTYNSFRYPTSSKNRNSNLVAFIAELLIKIKQFLKIIVKMLLNDDF